MLHRLPRLGAALMLSLFLFSASPAYAWHFHGGPVHDAENIDLEKKILEQVEQIHASTDRVAAYAIDSRLLLAAKLMSLFGLDKKLNNSGLMKGIEKYSNAFQSFVGKTSMDLDVVPKSHLELLQEMGAQLIPFSPIHDEKLPENIDGMLFHGGYPELYAKALSENKKMLTSVREAVQAGIPYMAECGGFMYLHQEMEDMEGHSWPMAGVIPGKSWRTPRLTRFGYITLEDGTCFGKNVGGIRAHEFHYFDSDNCGESYTARKPLSSRSWNCIHSDRQGMSGFPHMYYYSNLQVPEQFLRTCEERKA